MSTILKSLKRLEKEKEHQFVQNHVSLSSFNTQSTVNQTVRFAWLKNRLIQWSVVFTICVVGAFGIYTYTRPVGNKHKINSVPGDMDQAGGRKHHDTIAQSSTTGVKSSSDRQKQSHSPKTPVNKTISAMKSHSSESSGIPKSSKEFLKSRQYPAVQLPKVKRPSADNISETHADPITPSFPSAKVSKQVQPSAPTANPNETQVGRISGSGQRPSGESGQNQRSNTGEAEFQSEDNVYRNAERMTDGRLKVQAIVWAPDPQERMAVVNSQVIREGSVIEGFSIVSIGEDAVYVREDGLRLLKVPFGQP